MGDTYYYEMKSKMSLTNLLMLILLRYFFKHAIPVIFSY